MSDTKQEQMKKTKLGDRIRVTKERNGRYLGEIGIVIECDIDSCGYVDVYVDFPNRSRFQLCSDIDTWEPAEKTFATLQEGDVVTNDFGQKTILGVIRPGLYVLSSLGQVGGESQERVGDIYTAIDLEKYGWSIKQAAPIIVEKTIADVEQELKLPAGTLRIKKDAA